VAQKYKSIALDYRSTPSVAVSQLAAINTFVSDKKVIYWSLSDEFVGAVYDTVLGGDTASEFLGFRESDDAGIEAAIASRVVRKIEFSESFRYILIEVEKV
jgi:hypothetical protein